MIYDASSSSVDIQRLIPQLPAAYRGKPGLRLRPTLVDDC